MKRDFRAPKNKGIFEANFANKKYPQSKSAKSRVRPAFFATQKSQNYACESSLQCVIRSIRRGCQ